MRIIQNKSYHVLVCWSFFRTKCCDGARPCDEMVWCDEIELWRRFGRWKFCFPSDEVAGMIYQWHAWVPWALLLFQNLHEFGQSGCRSEALPLVLLIACFAANGQPEGMSHYPLVFLCNLLASHLMFGDVLSLAPALLWTVSTRTFSRPSLLGSCRAGGLHSAQVPQCWWPIFPFLFARVWSLLFVPSASGW